MRIKILRIKISSKLYFDFQYISSVEEAVWAVEVLKQKNLPIAVTLSISHLGDFNDVTAEECGQRLVEAGKIRIVQYSIWPPICRSNLKTRSNPQEKIFYRNFFCF